MSENHHESITPDGLFGCAIRSVRGGRGTAGHRKDDAMTAAPLPKCSRHDFVDVVYGR
jgi:hypothetical protein